MNILPGSNGEFYISRYDNNGNAENPVDAAGNQPQEYTSNTAQRNYGNNEYAKIYLPSPGWLTPILMQLGSGRRGVVSYMTALVLICQKK